MFVAVQFPLTDVRPFLHSETGRLSLPTWPLPEPDSDFIRSFGAVKRRLRGGISDWPGEEMYCRAPRALRFGDSYVKLPPDITQSGEEGRQHVAFRRFLADGCAVARYEVGLGYRQGGSWSKRVRLRSRDFIKLVRFVLSQEVLAPGDGAPVACELAEAGGHLARHYLRASTSLKHGGPEGWWVAAGDPMLLLEYEYLWDEDIAGFPKHARQVESPLLEGSKVRLAHMWVTYEGKQVGVWLLGRYKRRDGVYSSDRDALRRLRLNLFRLHAERESIKRVFRLLARKKIDVQRETPPTEELQAYLDNALKILNKQSRDGLPQSAILETAYHAEYLVDEGERATLLSQIGGIRRNLLHRVKSVTVSHEEAKTVYSISGGNVVVNQVTGKDVTVKNQSMSINNSTVGDINQVAADDIANSFNKVEQSSAPDELKEHLKQLSAAVAEMAKHLPEAKQREVAQDLKTLTDEALSESPRRKWYELSAGGLIEAAKTVGEIAAPVIATAKAVMTFLG